MPRQTIVTLAAIVDRRDRACIDVDTRVFHPRKLTAGAIEYAKEICRRCPVIHDCLAYATARDLDGIWAATTRQERRATHIGAPTDGADQTLNNYVPRGTPQDVVASCGADSGSPQC